MKTFAIGDIHGMKGFLDLALQKVQELAGSEPARVVFLGDYVDRGPDSYGVIETIKNGPKNPLHEWIALRGNHDDMMAREILGQDNMAWKGSYGDITLASYSGIKAKNIIDHVSWISQLPYLYADNYRYYCHAGMVAEIDAFSQSKEDLIWCRPDFEPAGYHGRPVVHGHTPRKLPNLVYKNDKLSRINLDTGACFSHVNGFLTLAYWENESDLIPQFYGIREGNVSIVPPTIHRI